MWHEEPGVPPSYTSWPYREGLLTRLRNRAGFAGWHWYMRPVMRALNRTRKAHGLRPLRRVDDVFSPLAQLSNMCPEFDYPRRALPPQFHYIGAFAAERKMTSDQDFPWEKLDGRPLVFASLGTVADPTNPPVFRKIVEACAGLDAQVVLALGNWKGEVGNLREQLEGLAENIIVVDFAPQMALLDRASLLITHGGSNTVLEALTRGVPMVALPRSADQLAMAARAVRAGVGLRASFQASTPEELRELVRKALTDESIRRRAHELRQAMKAAGGACRAAEISEMALMGRRPLLREEMKKRDEVRAIAADYESLAEK
jgi:MGT family glycosyltransferase